MRAARRSCLSTNWIAPTSRFEAFLLEVLSDYQVTVPEMGTVKGGDPAAGHHHIEPDA